MSVEIKRFADFADEHGPLEGSKLKIDEVLNVEIIITGYEIRQSKFIKDNRDKVMTLQFKILDEMHILFTGSEVLTKQMEKYKEHMPFAATIKRIDKYYTLS